MVTEYVFSEQYFDALIDMLVTIDVLVDAVRGIG